MTSSAVTEASIVERPDTGAGPERSLATGLAHHANAVGALVAAVALAVAFVAIPNWPVGVFQDDGIYVVLGKALASGEGYRYLNLPGAPYATHYPPGYPLLLALLWKLSPQFPQNVALFTFANAGFLALTAFMAFRFAHARLGLPALGAAAVAIAGSVSMPALIFGVFALSEPMFMALVIAVLLVAERAAERASWRDALIAGFAAGALAMVRTAGVFVVPALALVLVMRRRYVAAVSAVAAAAVFVVPWSVWVSAHGGEVAPVLLGKYGPYNTWLTDAIRAHGLPFVWDVIARNARALYGMSWVMVTGGPESADALHVPAAVAVATLLAVGAVQLARRAPVTAWYLVAYMALVIIWPFEPTRFVWALLPLFAAMLALGIAVVARSRPAPWAFGIGRVAVLAVAALLVAGFGLYNVNGVREGWRDSVPRVNAARATPVVDWVRANTKPADVIAMEDDPLIYLYTGRKAVPVGTLTAEEYLREQTYTFATEQLRLIIARYRPTYVIGTTSYGVMAARNLSLKTPPELRVHAVLRTAAIFTPVTPGTP